MMSEIKSHLLTKFNARSASIAIIGLGYVGLPLAVAFVEAGFTVIGIDVDQNKVKAINGVRDERPFCAGTGHRH